MKWPFSRVTVDDLALMPLETAHSLALQDIHAKTFARSWTDGEFADLLEKKNVFGFCLREPASRGGRTAGFVLLRNAADEAEVLTIGVDPVWQRHGVGRRLMAAALAEMNARRVSSLFLEVDETNAPALALYRKLGFEPVAKRQDYYEHGDGRRSTALVMRRQFG